MCCNEGELRAFLDCELYGAAADAVAGHLTGCEKCARIAEHLKSRASMVRAEMQTLDALFDEDEVHARRSLAQFRLRAEEQCQRGYRWILAACVLPVAVLGIALLLTPSKQNAPYVLRTERTANSTVGKREQPLVKRAVAKRRHVRRVKPSLDGFLLLDDSEPLESGIVVRVNIPRTVFASMAATPAERQSAGDIEAEVLVGQDGAARAVRFVR